MDAQFGLASRDDLWRLQNEMKNVYATQAEHADRLMRLERRQDDDVRVKSVWGTQSPFPSILSGTPQQDPGYNPAAEAFKNFDQDQPSSLLGSLHLDPDDEPRRGASRANSVRFDESALHGHFAHTSRSSTEYLPLRTGSGIGSHPMTERSSSHKSDGRQSSAGQSTHSARANSFGFEPRPLSAAVPPFVPLGPPPGLFILGPVPSIIRCWLDTKFSNESLLYAAVCTGAFRSVLDSCLASRLGFEEHITTNHQGERLLKIPVYLPEAIIQQSSSRANSPAPQLPLLTVEFSIQNFPTKSEAIQIFLGCDVLRARNADIHFSLDRMTLFDDERNKLSIPLVRPENATAFQSLRTTNFDLNGLKESIEGDLSKQTNDLRSEKGQALNSNLDFASQMQEQFSEQLKTQPSSMENSTPISSSSSIIGEGRKSFGDRENGEKPTSAKSTIENRDLETFTNGNPPETPTRFESGNIWGSWRRDSMQNGRLDLNSSNATSTSGYQRPGRGRGMKVLKPARLNTSRSTSASQTPVGFDAAPARLGEAGRGVGQTSNEVQSSASPATDTRSSSSDAKIPLQPPANKPRSSNPVGGASAFGWLNSGEQKQSPIASE
ncbi:hypothetical protein MMC22_007799 [Lobaria immixta]|nr:hypothetical protein [Lobaria immixta]